jgi:hypothetical protein
MDLNLQEPISVMREPEAKSKTLRVEKDPGFFAPL